MKVMAYVNVPPHLEASGAANAARRLSVALARHCEIELVVPGDRPETRPLGPISERVVQAHNPLSVAAGLLPNRVLTPFYRTNAADLVAGYELVHLHNPIPAFELRRVARACRHLGVPYVLSTHGIVEVEAGRQAYGLGRLETWAWRKLVAEPFREVVAGATRLFALSRAGVEILTTMGVSSDRVRVVPNGVDVPELMDQAAARLHAVRNSLPWPKPDAPVILFVGNHTRNKGLPVLLEALHATDRPYFLIAAGSKRSHIDYEAFAAGLAPHQHVRFPGFVPESEVAGLYQYADLLILPTLADTFPLVVLEAMAGGLAVLATRVGGIPHQLPPECGVLVSPGDAAALRRAFESMTRDRETLAAMGRAGRAHVSANFSWDTAAELAHAGYAEIVAEAT